MNLEIIALYLALINAQTRKKIPGAGRLRGHAELRLVNTRKTMKQNAFQKHQKSYIHQATYG